MWWDKKRSNEPMDTKSRDEPNNYNYPTQQRNQTEVDHLVDEIMFHKQGYDIHTVISSMFHS